MKCHEVDYEIIGNDMQIVEVELDPNETVIAEAGAMQYLNPDITFEVKMGDGSKPESGLIDKLFSAGKRALTGESLFLTHFTNSGSGKKRVAFASPYPGSIVPLDLSLLGEEITCQKDVFLCAALGTEISMKFNKKIGAGFFGGEGFILQHIKGDGMVFIHACGSLIKKELDNETLIVDTGALVAFSPGIDFDIATTGGLKKMMFSGEGFFQTTLSGTGTVYLQSLPFSRLVSKISQSINSRKSS